MKKILVIEDDPLILANVLELLEEEGYQGVGAGDGRAGVSLALAEPPDLVICDVLMPELDGFGVLEVLRRRPETAGIPLIFLTARAGHADLRAGMAAGADDYVTKPFTQVELLAAIQGRLRRHEDLLARAPMRVQPPTPPLEEHGVVLRDPAMRAVHEQAARAAASPISVLLLGETGVGKEILAHAIHRGSPRAKGPFLELHCQALPETLLESELFGHEKGAFTGAVKTRPGLFESARGGTVFLDEVGELPLATQVKLLYVLAERRVLRVGGREPIAVDVRFVAATNQDLESEVERGRFREDLYFRLNGITLTIPPLRARRSEIEPLATLFIQRASATLGRATPPSLSPEASILLQRYRFPGNVRELRNIIERAVVLCDGEVILPEHLPPKLIAPRPEPQAPAAPVDLPERLRAEMEAVERSGIIDALARCGGNQTQAAELLGVSRRTLVSRLASYDLQRRRKPAAG